MNGGAGSASGLESMDNDAVLVYPNPAKDFVMLRTSEAMQGIRIFNSTGKVIFNKSIDAKETRITTSDFVSGLYMIQIDTKTAKFNRSILIEK
jgi:hypothetical protein